MYETPPMVNDDDGKTATLFCDADADVDADVVAAVLLRNVESILMSAVPPCCAES